MRTAIADGTAVDDELMKQAPSENEFRYVLMVGARDAVLKETCHIIRVTAFKSGKRRTTLWKPTASTLGF
jgi:hypothetical protein